MRIGDIVRVGENNLYGHEFARGSLIRIDWIYQREDDNHTLHNARFGCSALTEIPVLEEISQKVHSMSITLSDGVPTVSMDGISFREAGDVEEEISSIFQNSEWRWWLSTQEVSLVARAGSDTAKELNNYKSTEEDYKNWTL